MTTSKRRPPAAKSPAPSVEIVWTKRAERDLVEIGDYIARDNPAAAERWVGLLLVAVETAAATPRAGRIVPEAAREDIREVFQKTYRIIYRVREGHIAVLTIFEGHRRLPHGALTEEDA